MRKVETAREKLEQARAALPELTAALASAERSFAEASTAYQDRRRHTEAELRDLAAIAFPELEEMRAKLRSEEERLMREAPVVVKPPVRRDEINDRLVSEMDATHPSRMRRLAAVRTALRTLEELPVRSGDIRPRIAALWVELPPIEMTTIKIEKKLTAPDDRLLRSAARQAW